MIPTKEPESRRLPGNEKHRWGAWAALVVAGLLGPVTHGLGEPAPPSPSGPKSVGTTGEDAPASVAFEAADAAFDPARPVVYLTDYEGRALVALNLTNGVIEQQFSFADNPESLTIAPNGRKMYVALLRRPHSPYWGGGHSSTIVEFDLPGPVKVREFAVAMDPYDMVVTDEGILVITSGSDQWTEIATYRAADGARLDSRSIRQRSRVSLHPSQEAVYTADTDLSPSDIRRYNFGRTTGAFADGWDSPYHGQYPMSGNVWCHPDGSRLIVRGGGVFSSSADKAQDMVYQFTLAGGQVEAIDFDEADEAMFTLGGGEWHHYNLETLELVRSMAAPAGTRFIHAAGEDVFVGTVGGGRTVFERYANPAAGAAGNEPPVAAFTFEPAEPTTMDEVLFDASATRDDQDDPGTLEYRWDWDGDGAFDTEFTHEPAARHRFRSEGRYTVTLLVRDRFGATGRAEQSVLVRQADDPGEPGGGNTPFGLDFQAADAAFDPAAPFAYLSDYEGRAVVMLNLTNGLVQRRFTFEWKPESITVSPDGRKMYVALLQRPHNYYWFGGHTNAVAVFDLERRVKTGEYLIDADPYDMVVTDGGILVTSGGSGQWTELVTYRAATGDRLGSAAIRHLCRLALHPSQEAVYAATTDLIPSDLLRYNIDPQSGAVTGSWDSPYHGDYAMKGRVWCHPDGERILAGGGFVFRSSPDQSQDLRYLADLDGGAVDAVTFDADHQAMLAVSGTILRHHDLASLELMGTMATEPGVRWLHAQGRQLHLLRIEGTRTLLSAIRNPALPEPWILEAPSSQAVRLGETVTFNVRVRGRPPFRYQWLRNGEPLPAGTNQVLVLENVQVTAAGSYRVTVSNAFGEATSEEAVLTVLLPPQIVGGPESLTLVAGEDGELVVETEGAEPMRYQWSRDGTPLPGATNRILTLSRVQASDAGAYVATVENSVGMAVSRPAILRVIPSPPRIVRQPAGGSWPAGTNAMLTVDVRGTKPLRVQWFKDEAAIPGANQATLLLPNVQASHAGTYHCAVSNLLGEARSEPTAVEVLPAAPWFWKQPEDRTVQAGEPLALEAGARGSEPLSYQWRHDGEPVDGATGAVWTLTEADLAASGDYDVVASNAWGAATSRVARVVVLQPPRLAAALTNQLRPLGETCVLAPRVTAHPAPTYTWFHHGLPLPGQTNATLTLPNLTPADAGAYAVRVRNELGTVETSMTLFVHPLPGMVVGWGDNVAGQAAPPPDLPDAVAVAGGDFHSVALLADGTMRAWGRTLPPPAETVAGPSPVVQVAAGAYHSLALKLEGRVVAWGLDDFGQASVPPLLGGVAAIAAGETFSVAVRQDGSIVQWGTILEGTIPQPEPTGFVVAVAAGRDHVLALRNDGTVIAWGNNAFGQAEVPPNLPRVKAVAAGYLHNLALLEDGGVVAWGDDSAGQTSVPEGLRDVVAVAAGDFHSLALQADGTVVIWGGGGSAVARPPAELRHVRVLASGLYHGLAIEGPRLRGMVGPEGIILSWEGPFRLESAPAVSGPYLPVAEGSPQLVVPEEPQRFYRLRSRD